MPETSAPQLPDALADEITTVVRDATGLPVRLLRASPLAGGASMETWSLDLRVGDDDEALVLRRDMGANMHLEALSRAQEFAVLQAAAAQGVRAPRPRWLHAPEGGRHWFLMDRHEGDGVGRRVVKLPALAAARAGLAGAMGEQLARIHRIPTTDLAAVLPGPGARTPAAHALAQTRDAIATLPVRDPAWTYALRWLAAREPAPPTSLTVVHGDFRVGNLLVAPDGLRAVLDWEFAHLGDPHEDLGWPMVRDWRFESDALRVGGVGRPEDLYAGYRDAGGGAVDASAVAWWEICGNLRWSVICHTQAARHLSGADPSVELASLGRKSAEITWEMLNLMKARR
jgi:aminoglycoside phosphotransferase (APT) family kinase protein